jgi:hypothetical protein
MKSTQTVQEPIIQTRRVLSATALARIPRMGGLTFLFVHIATLGMDACRRIK